MENSKTILLVEDDPVQVEYITHFLSGEGYHVLAASNGWKAMAILERKRVDLIITDLMMPELSGAHLLSLLKRYNLHPPPIIVVSGMDKAYLNSIYQLDVNQVIHKPIEKKLLLARVKEMFQKSNITL